LLTGVAPSITKVHTDGLAIRALRKDLLVWEHSETAMNFTKWWPGKIVFLRFTNIILIN
jgi:hypothetical protein